MKPVYSLQLRIFHGCQKKFKKSELENISLVDLIKRLVKIINKKIKVHLMSELKHFMVYSPENEVD